MANHSVATIDRQSGDIAPVLAVEARNSRIGPRCVVRSGLESDVAAIVEVHRAAFEGFFLTLLGTAFLQRLYRAFINDNSGVCLVVEVDEPRGSTALVGFVVGSMRPEMFFRKLFLQQGMQFALNALPALLCRPLRVLPRVLSAVRYRGDRPAEISELQGAALLSSIAVHPRMAKQGVGRLLLDAFCDKARDAGAPSVYLLTDRSSNEVANTLYARAGFQIVGTHVRRDGRVMNTYSRRLLAPR